MSIAEKLETIANNTVKVYEAGKQAEYDRFWDEFQQNGTLDNYNFCFSGRGWKQNNLNPKYNIIPRNMTNCFYQINVDGEPLSLIECFKSIIFDTSKASNMANCFYNSGIKDCPEISTISTNDLSTMFSYSKVEHIKKLILKNDGSQILYRIFFKCTNLERITIEGIIGDNLDVSDCPLNKNSIISIINALSLDTLNRILTFSKNSVDLAFETSEGMNDGSLSEEWLALVASNSNWNIELI